MKVLVISLLLIGAGIVLWLRTPDPMMESRVSKQHQVKPALPKATNGPNLGWRGWTCPEGDAARGFTACAEFRDSNGTTFTAQRHNGGWYEVESYTEPGKVRRRFTISNGAVTSAEEQRFQMKEWQVTKNLPLSLDEEKTAQLRKLEQFEGWQDITPNKKRSGPKRPEQ